LLGGAPSSKAAVILQTNLYMAAKNGRQCGAKNTAFRRLLG
jgi:hypothetical protein